MSPNLTIKDCSKGRGPDGTTTTLDFPVVLDAPSASDTTVSIATKDFPVPGPMLAKPGVDYDAKSEDVVIPAGQTSATFSVTIHGTAEHVTDKLFMAQVVKANVPIHDGSAFGILKYGTAPQAI